jgi:hypothetical protein
MMNSLYRLFATENQNKPNPGTLAFRSTAQSPDVEPAAGAKALSGK